MILIKIILVSSMALLVSLASVVGQHRKPDTTKPVPESSKESTPQHNIEKLINIRNRTSISKEQAKVLQNVFEMNKFPDSKVRKKLQEMTGLPSRVIQVWFQNRRREKKMITKQKEKEQEKQTSNYDPSSTPTYQEL